MSENTTPTPDARGWPDAERPGYPLNPVVSGAHEIQSPGNPEPFQAFWLAPQEIWILRGGGNMRPEGMAIARYLGPCLTPAQVDAAVRAEREACAVQCNDMGAEEQHNFGLGRAAQNYYRARDAIRARGTTDAGDTK